jgi:hypothetical protein
MSIYYNKFYYDKFCSALANGGLRITARLRVMLVSVVVAMWLRYLFVFFLTFMYACTIVDDYS